MRLWPFFLLFLSFSSYIFLLTHFTAVVHCGQLVDDSDGFSSVHFLFLLFPVFFGSRRSDGDQTYLLYPSSFISTYCVSFVLPFRAMTRPGSETGAAMSDARIRRTCMKLLAVGCTSKKTGSFSCLARDERKWQQRCSTSGTMQRAGQDMLRDSRPPRGTMKQQARTDRVSYV